MKLLDLYCGAGGASMGYHRAGFDVVGVDLIRHHSYPFELRIGDALRADLSGFDAVHASPPCLAHTVLRARWRPTEHPALFPTHPELIGPTRELLRASGLPYVIENVIGAPLESPITLCGSMFGLAVRRHRLFESNIGLTPPPCRHDLQPAPVGVYGHGGAWTRTQPGGGGRKVAGAEAADALGIDWTERQADLAKSIPPAYTEWIGRRLIDAIGGPK